MTTFLLALGLIFAGALAFVVWCALAVSSITEGDE
jgi:hypothetical protein